MRLWGGSLCWGGSFRICRRGRMRRRECWGIGGCRSWSARECGGDRGGIAGRGCGGQRHRRQVNWTCFSQPKKFPENPSTHILLKSRISLDGGNQEPGLLFVAGAEVEAGSHW